MVSCVTLRNDDSLALGNVIPNEWSPTILLHETEEQHTWNPSRTMNSTSTQNQLDYPNRRNHAPARTSWPPRGSDIREHHVQSVTYYQTRTYQTGTKLPIQFCAQSSISADQTTWTMTSPCTDKP
jgi:hypothetical protein